MATAVLPTVTESLEMTHLQPPAPAHLPAEIVNDLPSTPDHDATRWSGNHDAPEDNDMVLVYVPLNGGVRNGTLATTVTAHARALKPYLPKIEKKDVKYVVALAATVIGVSFGGISATKGREGAHPDEGQAVA
ncbi:hypothetical protein H2201_004973 [Coniosporium apollinis]|uniref:Uncharacterized protein n=2 Tax=Coniosporium TaxID=2810619 RepID=A0ABQ9NRC1_9PEZI|nr:hypothetical protein H2199_000211 [Cladosporium sp. JES 115]KAJ9664921.1 hypothetical protein H2201_004973 [Coniosporium apollinis]